MKNELFNLSRKVTQYKEVLANTEIYRKSWHDGLKDLLVKFLETSVNEVGLVANVEVRSDIKNLEEIGRAHV